MASLGPATSVQIAFEMLNRAANVEITFLPYSGVAPAISALLGEHVTSVLASYSTASEQLKAGKLRAPPPRDRGLLHCLRCLPSQNRGTQVMSWTTGLEWSRPS